MTSRRKKKRSSNKRENPYDSLIPTGSTLLNCALADNPFGGFRKGRIVNLIGDSSAGKCVKNAYVLNSNGLSKIDNIGEEKALGLSEYVDTVAVDKSTKETTSHFWKEEVQKTIKIKTRHGFEIEGTECHPIMVYNFMSFEFEMKKLKDVEVDDIAVIAKGTHHFSNKKTKIPKVKIDTTNVITANLPKYMDKNVAELMGYIVADGSFIVGDKPRSIAIPNTKPYVQDRINKICSVFGLHFSKINTISSVHLSAVMMSLFNTKSNITARNKYVPDCILSGSKEIQVHFLKALIDCDGWASDRGISYYTSSKELSMQVQLMLLNLGILSSRKEKIGAFDGTNYHDHSYWSVSIYGEDINKYLEIIGSLKYDLPKKSRKRKSDYDTVPNLVNKMKKDIRLARRKVGWKKNGICTKHKKRFPRFKFGGCSNASWEMIEKFIVSFSDFPINMSFYKSLLNSDYHFDKIFQREEKEEETIVYDFHIPETHLFWSNGFVSHNTILALTCFAEVAQLSDFDDYKLIFDDAECGEDFDKEKLFGKKLVKRLEAPRYDENKEPISSVTVQDFHMHIKDALKGDKPFIYILDSFDSVTSEEDQKHIDEMYKAWKKDTASKGSYGTAKARIASQLLSDINIDIKKTNSIVIIISQTRDNLSMMSFSKKTRSGGKALKFYSWHEIWLALGKKEKSKDTMIGVNSMAKIEKNRQTGKRREATFPIYYDYGVDDIKSCVAYLDSMGVLKKKKNTYEVPELDFEGSKQKLVSHIEDNNLENELKEMVGACWNDFEEELKLKRKKKFE